MCALRITFQTEASSLSKKGHVDVLQIFLLRKITDLLNDMECYFFISEFFLVSLNSITYEMYSHLKAFKMKNSENILTKNAASLEWGLGTESLIRIGNFSRADYL